MTGGRGCEGRKREKNVGKGKGGQNRKFCSRRSNQEGGRQVGGRGRGLPPVRP